MFNYKQIFILKNCYSIDHQNMPQYFLCMRKYKLEDISIYKTRLMQLGMMELQFKSSIIETKKKTYCSYKTILIQLEIIKPY